MMMADWGGLHGDFIGSIIKKISSVEDFVVFGSVCKSWNSEAASDKNNKMYLRRCPQVPWLMLADTDTDTTGNQQIHILRKENTFFTKSIYVPEMSHKTCIGLNYGWVLTRSNSSERNLVHPIYRHCFQLPETDNIIRAALSANPLESASDFVVMIVHIDGGMSYWKPGLERWTRLEKQDHQFYKDVTYEDVTYYQDQFYGLTRTDVWAFKFSSGCSNNNINIGLVAKIDFKAAYRNRPCISYRNRPYIVGSESGLLVVLKDMKYGSDKFHVYELNWINGSGYMRMIKSLGDRAIFVGDQSWGYHHTEAVYNGKVDEKAFKAMMILISASVCILVVGCFCIFILTNGVSKQMNLSAALGRNLDARRKAEHQITIKASF